MSEFKFIESDPDVVRNFSPRNENVLVLLDLSPQSSASGLILIPTKFQATSPSGIIVASAPDIPEAYALVPGAHVMVSAGAGTMIHNDTKTKREFVCFKLEDILAIME